jgi:thioredoxin-like negative regulator of GroEL
LAEEDEVVMFDFTLGAAARAQGSGRKFGRRWETQADRTTTLADNRLKPVGSVADFEAEILSADRALVLFASPGTFQVERLIDDLAVVLATQETESVAAWVDPDHLTELAPQFGITAIPCLAAFVKGQLAATRLSRPSITDLRRWVEVALS